MRVLVVAVLLLPLLVRPGHAALSDVRINEFLASNASGLADEDGAFSDWIELHNTGAETESLGGTYLTDTAGNLTKWQLPAVSLPPGGFLIVFASSKNRAVAGQELHTNFALGAGGEYLGFVAPDGTTVLSEYAPSFPPQTADISYGVDPASAVGYLNPPTPGAANGAVYEFVLPLQFSPAHGFYSTPQNVTITTPTPGAEIRYTTDGSLPTPTHGSVYAGPIPVGGTTVLRAAGFKAGAVPTLTVSHSLIFLSQVLTQTGAGFPADWGGHDVDYAMGQSIVNDPVYGPQLPAALTSIPTISIIADVADLFGPNGIWSRPTKRGDAWVRLASIELINPPGGGSGFATATGIRIHGNSSRRPAYPKHSIRLSFNPDFGAPPRLNFTFPGSTVGQHRTLVLRQPHDDGWLGGTRRSLFVRDQYASDTQLALGQVAAHGFFVHVYLNGLYWGVYDMHERPDDWFAAFYFGGDHDDYDVYKEGKLEEGEPDAWETMLSLANQNVATQAGYDALREYLDVDNLIGYLMTLHYVGTYEQEWVAARRRLPGEQWRFFPWDQERCLKSVRKNSSTTGRSGGPTGPYRWLRTFSAEFRLLFADHVHRHYFNDGALTTAAATARFMTRVNEISAAMIAESARWGDSRHRGRPFTRDGEWQAEVDKLLAEFFPARSAVVLDQYRALGLYPAVVAPSFDQYGGTVSAGFVLTMAAPAGVIWYTTDSSDPRLPGGAVAPSAVQYTPGVVLGTPGTVVVKARVLSGSEWSALNAATFVVQ